MAKGAFLISTFGNDLFQNRMFEYSSFVLVLEWFTVQFYDCVTYKFDSTCNDQNLVHRLLWITLFRKASFPNRIFECSFFWVYTYYYTHHAWRHFYEGKKRPCATFWPLWVIYVKELLLALLHRECSSTYSV